ncbi:hypothetical protein HPB47_018967 [Ixodes persulcatus]|uniref:Uncharacterized protein n=1 Tax=Ixodes persulcatus TaxID=34615 RepID=A0AC60QZV2_IXOPE|nr:hypothetical protein HPB47_018967 [Ixodes persulcatus]
MAHDMQWVLEYILMRMRSPQLYEYVRKHKILALSSKSCLDKHMQEFKSTSGFNTSVFSALEKRTKDMEEFSRHGAPVYDETENINVTASGELGGLVDLSPFMEDSNETALSDHGLVIVFQPFKSKTFKKDCPFSIYLAASRDGTCLEVRSVSLDHNHDLSEALFRHLPQQRKLPPNLEEKAKSMLQLKANKKLVREQLEKESSKVITLKDLTNLAAKSKSQALRNDLEATVNMLNRMY